MLPSPTCDRGPGLSRLPTGTGHRASFFVLVYLAVLSACGGPTLAPLVDSVDFGSVQVGSTVWVDVDLQLDSGGPAELLVRLGPSGGPFLVDTLPPPVLEDGQASAVRIGFHPSSLGVQLAAVIVEATNVEGVTYREVLLRGEGVAGPLDLDRDGFPEGKDCDDTLASVHPGAEEVCDGVDTDCDPSTEAPGGESDADTDGWSGCAGDCDDSSGAVYPGATELCDGLDNDCDGDVSEADADGDGYRDCDGDCDDSDSGVHPGANEACDGLDTDCDGLVPDDELDLDGDGGWGCDGDCDDSDPAIHPGASEVCDGLDSDCDPGSEAPGGESDGDGDGSLACADCDDSADTIFPGAPELCDGLDNDCDQQVPTDEVDDDGDGYTECSGFDCDDTDSTIHSFAIEECFDAVDNDCDGVTNGGCACPIWAWNQSVPICTSPGSFDCPHGTIAGALAAEAGTPSCAEVWLRGGTYTELVTLDGLRVIRGPGDPSDVILDGGGSGQVILVEEDAQVALSSMTVTGGYALEGGGLQALDNSYVSLTNMVFSNNECEAGGVGGGVHFSNAEFAITDSVFVGNDCGYGETDTANDGGAIACQASEGLIEGNLFDGNSAGDGSDIYVTDSVGTVEVIQNSFLGGTTADSSTVSGEWKGGAVLIGSNDVLVANNLFGGHTAAEGSSGVFVAWGGFYTQVLNNLFIYGSSPDGGAIQFGPTVQFNPPATVANNIVVENSGWGVYSDYGGQPSALSHNDVWANSLGEHTSQAILQPAPVFSLSVDPLFVVASTDDGDWSNDDFTLSSVSACIDAGRFSPTWLDHDGTIADLGIYGGPNGVWTPPLP